MSDVVAGSSVGTKPTGQQADNAWRLLILLALANVLNFYDRALPAILAEEVKDEFGLTDSLIGLMGAAFIVVYAVAGVALGRMADRGSRKRIMAGGLIVWSVMTALTGGAWSLISLLIIRLGVGIGEASYAPAANSTISDLFPAEKRARAVAVFQLGIPIGLILAFFTTGLIVDALDSWRAPFFIAAVPGIIVALLLLRSDEPTRGAAEPGFQSAVPTTQPSASLSLVAATRTVIRIRTMRWLILSGIGVQIAAYSLGTFLVPHLQRYFDLSLTAAGAAAGVILGFTGLAGLFAGGYISDRARRRSVKARTLVGGYALAAAAPLSFAALVLGPEALGLFIAVMSLAWLLQFFFHTSALPAVSDVIDPALRATAVAVFFALFYLLGGGVGPILTGVLSDILANGNPPTGVSADAHGLQQSLLIVVPAALLLGGLGLLGASRHIERESAEMLANRS